MPDQLMEAPPNVPLPRITVRRQVRLGRPGKAAIEVLCPYCGRVAMTFTFAFAWTVASNHIRYQHPAAGNA